jgi:HK97 gp10 family phage protein
MAQSRIRIVNRFPAAREAAYETVQFARELALREGKDVANAKIASGAARRSYEDLGDSLHVEEEKIGFQSGKIYVTAHSEQWGDDPFWARFFEYGTTFISAMPFMRPGSRAMRKTFIGVMGKDFEGFIRRRSRL